jgi:hypothetical protein
MSMVVIFSVCAAGNKTGRDISKVAHQRPVKDVRLFIQQLDDFDGHRLRFECER